MDYIAVYGLGLLFYTTLKTAEELRLPYHIKQLINTHTIGGKPLGTHDGTNSAGRTAG